jgi:hypothetical protein
MCKVKAKKKTVAKVGAEELAALIKIGSMMSNLCFNLKQYDGTRVRDARTMEELHQAWDAAHVALTDSRVARYGRCQVCGCKVGPTSDICGECMCEDDWY